MLLAVLAAVAMLAGAAIQRAPAPLPAQPAAVGFVTSSGGQLYLGGLPWRFTGYDAFRLTSTKSGFQCGGVLSDGDLNSIFAQMAQNSGTVAVRTWFFQSYGRGNRWDQYDRVLNAAAAHGVEVIPTLVNEWRECEPRSGEAYRDVSWYEGGYKQPESGYSMSFRDFAVAMARHYANNPTIAFWQLVNEAEAKSSRNGSCDSRRAALALRSFGDDVTGAIKSVDPHHLVNLGTMGGGQCGTQESLYEYVNGGRTDICEIHDYAHKIVMGDQWNGTVPDIKGCLAMGKPLFAGEVGIDASIRPDWGTGPAVTPSSLATRAAFFDAKARALFDLGASGFLIWGKSLQQSQHWWVGPGDPTERIMHGHQSLLNALRSGHAGQGQGHATHGSGAVASAYATGSPGSAAIDAIGDALDGDLRLAAYANSGPVTWVRGRFR